MPDVTQPRNIAANGTATPATATLAGVVAGDLLVCIIAVLGTSPTIATPTGDAWIQVQKTQGATLSFAMYILPNAGAGSHVPSAVLAGTVTGWILEVFEFTQTGANCGLQGSAVLNSAVAQLTNIFPATGNTLSNELFVYAVARATATMTPQNSFQGLSVYGAQTSLAAWSASVLPQAGVQGMSLDFFWASGLGQGVGQYPQASGLLSGAVASVAIAAWLNTIATQPSNNDNIYGNNGVLVGGNYQGMLGG